VPYAPDYVAYPASHDQVCLLVELAVKHGVHLIPFGGGSNIAGCIELPRPTNRAVVSVDMRLMKAVWDNSPEYLAGGYKVRRVFETPGKTWFNEETGGQEMLVGTSDLDWCKRVIEEGHLKEQWPELAKERYPFVIDTAIPCMHQDRSDGTQYPVQGILAWAQENGNA